MTMSESAYETTPEDVFLNVVSLMAPEDAVNALKQNIVENWWRKIMLWLKDFGASASYDIPWVEAYKAVQLLEQSPGPESLAKLGANYPEGFTLKVIAQLWDKLNEEQQKRVLRSVKHDIALHGLEYFFNSLPNILRREVSQKGGDTIVASIQRKAYEFMGGKTSFEDLMATIADLASMRKNQPIYESYMKAVALGRYVSRPELKKLVPKLFSLSSSS